MTVHLELENAYIEYMRIFCKRRSDQGLEKVGVMVQSLNELRRKIALEIENLRRRLKNPVWSSATQFYAEEDEILQFDFPQI